MADKFDTFLKVMEMTTSSHDNEALTALRKANSLLAEQNVTWTELLRAKVKFRRTTAEERTDKAYRDHAERKAHHVGPDEELDAMFQDLVESIPAESTFREVVLDVLAWWEEKGFLTARQYEMIRNAHARI